MIVPVALVVVVGLVVLSRRSLSGLGALTFERGWLVVLAIGLQVVAFEVLPAATPGVAAAAVHVASYAAALSFVWVNRRRTGLVVLGVGGLLNLAAIAANDGTMPADPGAVARAGIDPEPGHENSAPDSDARLAPLGDVFAVPEQFPLANVFSIGDVLIVAGAGLVVRGAYEKSSVTPRSAGAPAVTSRTS